MKTKQTSTFKLAKNMVPVGLLLTIQHQSGVEAAQVDTQAHIQEIASLVSSALNESEESAQLDAGLSVLSTEEINAQIHSTIEEAIKSQESAKAENKANSKLGFLQKVVTLDCFFGGSDCLFANKKSMMEGKVTEFAQKRFEAGNQDVNQYLAQVKSQVSRDLQANAAIKSIDNATQAPIGEANIQTESQYVERLERQMNENKLDRQLHDSVQGLLKLNQKSEADSAPNAILAKTEGPTPYTGGATTNAQLVKVPIDEKEAIGITVAPTWHLDDVMSVTLKAFRKVIGYDTFDSIRKGTRDEKKDTNDYYNVTVSMMIKRKPAEPAAVYDGDIFAGGKTLKDLLDKGFPYDDGDIDLASKVAAPEKTVAQIVGKLNGENITKQNLKNLVTDKNAPVTGALVQIDSQKSDADGLFKLMDANVTRGNLKNLLTDKPSPITVGLAQKSDADGLFKLMDANVTRGNLKNLLTDKPSPITVGLAQKSDADGLFKLMDANVTRGNLKNLLTDKPSPITVGLAQKSDADGLFKLMDANVTRGNLKNLLTDKPSPITVGLAQKSDADGLFKLMDANVTRGNLKNLLTDKPSPITVGLAQKSDADGLFKLMDANVTRGNLKNLLTDKPSPITVGLAQTSGVPVLVNPESTLYANTQAATDFGFTDIPVGLDELNFVQSKSTFMPIAPNTQKVNNLAIVERNANALELAQVMPLIPESQKPGNLAVVDRNANALELAQLVPLSPESQKPGNLAVVERNAEALNFAQVMPIAPNTQKVNNLAIVERNANALEFAQVMPIAPNTQQVNNLAIVERNANALEFAQTSTPVDSSNVQSTAPGDFNIVDQEAVDSTLIQTGKVSQKSANGLN